jgi:dihydropteroate synthase
MHTKGMPKVMQSNPDYLDVIEEISVYLEVGISRAQEVGIEQIIVDPGIGFGKRREHNLTILKNLREFQKLGFPVLVGPSRKSFIGNVPMEQRLEGTAAAVTACAINGAQIVRVHDVAEMKRVLAVADAIARA